MSAESVTVRLRVAVADGQPLAEIATELDRIVFDAGGWSPSDFEDLIAILGSAAFSDHADSLPIVKLFEDHHGLLTADQRASLSALLPDLVLTLRDDIAAFLAAELLVEVEGSGRDVLARIDAMERRAPRDRLALVVHAFDWLCKRADDVSVRTDCLARLRRLERHADAVVAREARAALARRSRSAG